MFTSKLFRDKKEFTRSGELKKVVVPAKLMNAIGSDFVVDEKKKCVKFTEGNEVFVCTEKFGVAERTDLTLFTVDGGMLINICSGKVYIEDEVNNTLYSISETGEVEYPQVGKEIHWVTLDTFMDYARVIVKTRYGVTNRTMANKYIHNLGFGVTTGLSVNRAQVVTCFSWQFTDFYTDLACGFPLERLEDPEITDAGAGVVGYSNFKGDVSDEDADFEDDVDSDSEVESEDADDTEDERYGDLPEYADEEY